MTYTGNWYWKKEEVVIDKSWRSLFPLIAIQEGFGMPVYKFMYTYIGIYRYFLQNV